MEREEKRKLSNLDFLIESAKETIEYYESEIKWKEESKEETDQDLKETRRF